MSLVHRNRPSAFWGYGRAPTINGAGVVRRMAAIRECLHGFRGSGAAAGGIPEVDARHPSAMRSSARQTEEFVRIAAPEVRLLARGRFGDLTKRRWETVLAGATRFARQEKNVIWLRHQVQRRALIPGWLLPKRRQRGGWKR